MLDSVSSKYFLKQLIKLILHSMLEAEGIDIVLFSTHLSIQFVHMIKQIFVELLIYGKTEVYYIYAFKVKDSFQNFKE